MAELVTLFDAETGREVRVLQGQPGAVHEAAWSPDSRLLATGAEDGTVPVWEVASGKAARTLGEPGSASSVWSVSWSPDGLRLASAGADGTVRIWDPFDDPEARTLDGGLGRLSAIAWEPGGPRLASAHGLGSGSRVRLWDLGDGRIDRRLSGTGGATEAIAWSPAGRRLVAHVDDLFGGVTSLVLWDLAARGPGRVLPIEDGPVFALGWASEERFIAVTGRTLRTWVIGPDGPSLATPVDLEVGRRPVVAVSPVGGRLAVAEADRPLRVLDAGTGRPPRVLEDDDEGAISLLAWGPQARRLASLSRKPSADFAPSGEPRPAMLRIRDVEGDREGVAIPVYGEPVQAIAWHPWGQRIATATDDGAVTLWDIPTGQSVLRLNGPESPIALSWSADGRRLAVANDRITVWEATGLGEPAHAPSEDSPSGAE